MADEVQLDPLQQEAVASACNIENRVVVITGPAGTGKTTILKKVYDILTEHGYRVALTSPTGKAAKRIYEATGITATTMHRLLEYSHPGDPDPKTGKPMGVSVPRRNRQNQLEYDVVLGDEYAMVNEELHRALFDALPSGGVVRCFGDDNQLAPIEEDKNYTGPSPFQRLLDDNSGKFKVVRLETVFRQGKDSGILMNCMNILKGRYPTKNEQWSMEITAMAVDALKQRVFAERENGFEYDTIENQIIVPQNKSNVGTISINQILQGMYHSYSEPHMALERKSWVVAPDGTKGGNLQVFKGDKVVITDNLYDLSVFNGETGVIIEMELETGEIVIDFGDREQAIPPVLMVQNRHGSLSSIDPRKSIDLAYALTTHKTQGSEYKRGIYIINRSNSFMLSRRNFYTAVSRFKQHVHVIADQPGLARAIQNKG